MFGDERPAPEEVNESAATAALFELGAGAANRLFEPGETLPVPAEDFKKLVPEGLCVGSLGLGAFPLAGEGKSAVFYFI